MQKPTENFTARPVGSLVEGKYRIDDVINSGGLSCVYRVTDIDTNKRWALKEYILNEGENLTAEQKKHNRSALLNLKNETEALQQLRIRQIPSVHDTITHDNNLFIVMDYIQGPNLFDYVNQNQPLDRELGGKIAIQLALFMQKIHSQNPPIIHRDIKPSNIILLEDGETISIIDFGTIRAYEAGRNRDKTLLGTPEYASPELLGRIRMQTDARSDIYSFGKTLYELLTGLDPVKMQENIQTCIREEEKRNSKKSKEGLLRIAYKCVSYRPEDRFQNAEELLHALRHDREIRKEYQKEALTELLIKIITAALSLPCMLSALIGLVLKRGTMDLLIKILIGAGAGFLLFGIAVLILTKIGKGKEKKSREFASLVKETDAIDMDEDLEGTTLLVKTEENRGPLRPASSRSPEKKKTSGKFVVKTRDFKGASEMMEE